LLGKQDQITKFSKLAKFESENMNQKSTHHLSVEEAKLFRAAIQEWGATGLTDFKCDVCESPLSFDKFSSPSHEMSGGWLKCRCAKFTDNLRGL